MSPGLVLYILFIHFVADFVCQTNKMGLHKSHDTIVLTQHVTIYALALSLLSLPIMGNMAVIFGWANFLLHWPTDYFSSKLSSRYYKEGRLYAFWKVIGLDQLAHYAGLFYLYQYLT